MVRMGATCAEDNCKTVAECCPIATLPFPGRLLYAYARREGGSQGIEPPCGRSRLDKRALYRHLSRVESAIPDIIAILAVAAICPPPSPCRVSRRVARELAPLQRSRAVVATSRISDGTPDGGAQRPREKSLRFGARSPKTGGEGPAFSLTSPSSTI